jgi:hypothetical protein
VWRRALAGCALAALAATAHAEICKYRDPDGNIHYTNIAPEKGWKKLGCTATDDPTIRPAPSASVARAPTPSSFPKVDSATQKGRDDVRRKVLAEELAAEEKLLAEARVAYSDGAPTPLTDERGDIDKYRTRITKLRQAVTLHEKNVEALKKEIAAVK